MTNIRHEERHLAPRHVNAPSGGLRGLHAQTVDMLGERIVTGQYAPGTVLSVDTLRSELNISRTVLREAMRVLADKGLVDTRQKRGTQVTPRSAWSMLDPDLPRWMSRNPDHRFLDHLAEVRAMMEPAAARLAAERHTDEDLEALREALQAMEQADDDVDAAVEADLLFHRALHDAVHNDLLTEIDVIIEAGLRIRDTMVHGHGTARDPLPVHRAIVDAVEARDGQRAETAMLELLELARMDTENEGGRK